MPLRIYNTATRDKEEFTPQVPGKVTMYNCGPTVYDYFHIGNARNFVVVDTVRRYLEFRGYQVRFVQNFTDIDDKIIKRAQERGEAVRPSSRSATSGDISRTRRAGHPAAPTCTRGPPSTSREIARTGREAGSKRASPTPRTATCTIRVQRLPRLRQAVGQERGRPAGGRAGGGGRARSTTRWTSPSGRPPSPASRRGTAPGARAGRAGTSSAPPCRMNHLGETLDIHGGGEDLIFPHHENEIAQSEGATGKPFVALLDAQRLPQHRRARRCSKSLGNFFTIDEVLAKVPAEAVRFFLLSAHYRIRWTTAAPRCRRRRRPWGASARRCRQRRRSRAWNPSKTADGNCGQLRQLRDAFTEAMDDDFNTPARHRHRRSRQWRCSTKSAKPYARSAAGGAGSRDRRAVRTHPRRA